MERVWIFVSMLCLIAVAILLARKYYDAAFVAGVLSVVALFLNYRVRLRATLAESDETPDAENNDSEEPDES